MESSNVSDKKLPYEKPTLRVISLVAEEVLAVNCKADVGAPGKFGLGCGNYSCAGYGGS